MVKIWFEKICKFETGNDFPVLDTLVLIVWDTILKLIDVYRLYL